jgi:hypothetical protein
MHVEALLPGAAEVVGFVAATAVAAVGPAVGGERGL